MTSVPFLPELLAPAGSVEKLKTAISYGADAVFLGGQQFGLRASADNFSCDEIAEAVRFAGRHGAKVYVTLNAFLHSSDFLGLTEFCQALDACGVTAVIVSDLGVVRHVKKHSRLSVHLSTQASCLNSGAGLVWRDMGVERLILGRECAINEAQKISEATNLEVELFIHGSMCMAYSGHCTISNFTAGRDSNRGGCIQSCRFKYEQTANNGNSFTSHFMSSKDLNGIELVGEFSRYGIASLKIEGRMKSLLYVATTTSAYRQALDGIAAGTLTAERIEDLQNQLNAVPHRDFTEASLQSTAGYDSVFSENSSSTAISSHQLLGTVLEVGSAEMLVRLYRPIRKGMSFEALPFKIQVRQEKGIQLQNELSTLRDIMGRSLDTCRQDTVVWMNKPQGIEPYAVLRTAS
jgi:U32 family peptidase